MSRRPLRGVGCTASTGIPSSGPHHDPTTALQIASKCCVTGRSASDLTPLDAYLLSESHPYEWKVIDTHHANAVSARTLLHTLPEWESSRAEVALDEYSVQRISELRVVIAAALLVIFSLILTVRAPRTHRAWSIGILTSGPQYLSRQRVAAGPKSRTTSA